MIKCTCQYENSKKLIGENVPLTHNRACELYGTETFNTPATEKPLSLFQADSKDDE